MATEHIEPLKLLGLVLWKLRKEHGTFEVKITIEDFEAMQAAYGDTATVFTHNTNDFVCVSLMTREQAELIAACGGKRSPVPDEL